MARLAGRRALFAVPVLLVVTFGVFAIAAASPFDPVKAYAGTAALGADQQTLDRLRENLGVDRPFAARWWHWLTSALTGDLGHSSVMRQPVAQVIGERLVWSALLCAVAFAAAVLVGTVLGVLAARRPGSLVDRTVTSLAYTLEAAPVFWIALLAIWLFALQWDVLPAGGLTDTGSEQVTPGQVTSHLLLPAGVLAVSQLPWFTLYVRQGVGDALAEDPVRGARARGLSEATVRAPSGAHPHRLPRARTHHRGAAGGERLQLAGHRRGHRRGGHRRRLPAARRPDDPGHRSGARREPARRPALRTVRPEGEAQ
jgi:peptide/nickel transport system permease protein